jgi:hypothetical protein
VRVMPVLLALSEGLWFRVSSGVSGEAVGLGLGLAGRAGANAPVNGALIMGPVPSGGGPILPERGAPRPPIRLWRAEVGGPAPYLFHPIARRYRTRLSQKIGGFQNLYPKEGLRIDPINEGAEPAEQNPPLKRGRGRPKGYPKTEGAKKITTTSEVRQLIQSNAGRIVAQQIKIATGENIQQMGPTGKVFWAPGSVSQQSEAAANLLSKLLPDLRSQELSGANGADLFPALPSKAELTRVLTEALAETGQLAAPPKQLAPPLRALPAPTESAETPPPEVPRDFQQGETEVFGNGAYIQLVTITGSGAAKWGVYDQHGSLIAYKRNRDDAMALAQSLK